MSSSLASPAAISRSSDVAPAPGGPAISTREPLPYGAAFSEEGAARRVEGNTGVRSPNQARCSGGSASAPFTLSTRTSEGWRSLRRGGRTGPLDLVARAQLAAADLGRRHVDVVSRLPGGVDPDEPAAVGENVEHAGEGGLGRGAGVRLRFRFGLLGLGRLRLHRLGRLRLHGLGRLRLLGRLGLFGLLLLGLLICRGVLHRFVLHRFVLRRTGGSSSRFAGGPLERLVRRHLVRLGLLDRGDLLRLVVCALGAEDGADQVVPAHRAEALQAELGRDRVEIGERTVLELFALKHRHGGARP